MQRSLPVITVNRSRTVLSALMWIALLVYPFIVKDPFQRQVVLLVLMYGSLGAAWNLVGGYLGRVSFGASVFLGVGAYTTLLSLKIFGLTPWIGIPLGALLAALLALVVGIPTLKLKGHYFTMATIALLEVARLLATNITWTGGATGVEAPIADSVLTLTFRDKLPYYLMALGFAALTAWITSALVRTKLGYYWRAVQGEEAAARSLGVPTERYKMYAFVISAALTGLWGGFYGIYVGFIDPDSAFSLTLAVQIVLVVILGALGTTWGPWVGAALLIPLSEFTRVALGGNSRGLDLLLYGLVIILISLFRPGGLLTLWKPRTGVVRDA